MDTLEKKKRKANPVNKANVLSSLTFIYMFPIFKYSLKHELKEEDLFEPLNEHKSAKLGEKLEKLWGEERVKHKVFALHIALFKLFGLHFMSLGFLRLFDEIMMVIVPPFCIGRLISYYEDSSTTITELQAYLQALAITLCLIINTFLTHPTYMGLMHLTMKMRIACSSLIYRKVLRTSRASLANTTTGQVVNLLSNDVGKFDQGFMLAHYIWIAPIHGVVGTYFLYRQIGVSAFFGVALFVLYIPIQIFLSKRISALRLKTASRTDERVRLINEIVSGIQVIKMYCWEKPFEEVIAFARKKEMSAIRNRAFIQGLFYSFETFLARAAVFVSILGYVLLGSRITAEKVFTLKAIYDVLRSVLILHFWLSASSIAETNVSVLRIQKFLSHTEQKQKISKDTSNTPNVCLQNVNVKWLENDTESCLKDVNLNITSNQVVAVIGPVGSGKSTLLNLLLKELSVETGTLNVQGKISYSSQEPWLFAASVRQNILFNNEYNQERYQQVIEACALSSDLKALPYGDKTLVGEKGKVLSGGQKARINLARCIYNKADIYLLDDPLSAVDANVGNDLYQNCVKEFLKDKICVIVTHQLQYLSSADKIVVMKDGRIENEGTFTELQSKGIDVVKLIEKFQDEREEEIDDNRKIASEDNDGDSKDTRPSVEQEHIKKEGNNLGLYFTYFKAGGGTFRAIVLLGMFLSAQAVASAGDYYVSYWVRLEQDFSRKFLQNVTEVNETLNRNPLIYTYSGMILGTVVLSTTLSLYFLFHFTVASVNLHNLCFSNLMNATMRFININPTGRILNRFSKDLGAIDEYIPSILFDVIQVALMLLGSLIISFLVFYWLIIPAVLLFCIFYFLRIVYISTSRNIKRIEANTRSPIYGHATASIQGLSTIRNFSAQKFLIKQFDALQDNHSSAWFLFIAANRCFGFWVDVVCILFFAGAIVVFMYFSGSDYGGDIGLVMTQYTTFITALQWELRQLSELENNMVSVERLLEYKKIEVEPIRKKVKVSQTWPQNGKIEFKNVSLKYNSTDCNILKKLSFTIQPKEKIGIVGRTGAGKSSTITALFQLYPIEGSILIDEIDTTALPLEDVRLKISIIPQEPVLFSGTLRKNLDPFEEFSDEILWNALDQVELKNLVSEMDGLNYNVTEGGSNFSVGQRQLVCLARAVIRQNKIIVMDEATANVDTQTDAIIQNTIRNKFAECTVLSIAHRLRTVMDSDRILVMSDGRVKEFDHPYNLLKDKNGILYNLVQSTGKSNAVNLENVAKINYEKKITLS